MNCKCYKNKIAVFTNPVIKNVNSYLFALLQVGVMTLVITNNYNKAKLITNIDHTMNYQLIVMPVLYVIIYFFIHFFKHTYHQIHLNHIWNTYHIISKL